MTHDAEASALIHFAQLTNDDTWRARATQILSSPLDWYWIVMQATKHKVAQLVWSRLCDPHFIKPAIASSGLSKLSCLYLEQLSWVNSERNRLFLEHASELAWTFRRAELPLVFLKGTALVGDLYSTHNRMLHDIDVIAPITRRAEAAELCLSSGYRYGVYNYVDQSLDAMSERQVRFYAFYNHTLPPLYKATGVPHTPYIKVSIGADFFDRAEEFSLPSDRIIASARPKADGSGIVVPSDIHMLLNLCAHIYREGVSAVYAANGDNWQLTKFCDLNAFVLKIIDTIDMAALRREIAAHSLERPVYFALHYTHRVYNHPQLGKMAEMFEPNDSQFLGSIVDGGRSANSRKTFEERLFETEGTLPQGVDPTWYKVFSNADW